MAAEPLRHGRSYEALRVGAVSKLAPSALPELVRRNQARRICAYPAVAAEITWSVNLNRRRQQSCAYAGIQGNPIPKNCGPEVASRRSHGLSSGGAGYPFRVGNHRNRQALRS